GEAVPEPTTDDFVVQTDSEWALLHAVAGFPKIISESVVQRSCAPLANYVLDLAHLFTKFYHECPVLSVAENKVLNTRLQLCEVVLQTLSNALNVLGIDTPERM
ncbi:MAG: arginine--tRNA ligase, partial [Candidatus Hydrogenedentes bacterium]|nr:arginine--tRNA ligase [Candidatus Hydrogenedentota bacterium]